MFVSEFEDKVIKNAIETDDNSTSSQFTLNYIWNCIIYES